MSTDICTSIEQSKKLLSLGIDPNTADMWYSYYGNSKYNPTVAYKGQQWFLCQIRNSLHDDIPCWSLAALLNLLPSEFTEKGKYSETTYEIYIRKYALTENVDLYQIAYGNYKFYEDGNTSWKDMINTGEKENLIDAVFQMICWLKENNKL